MNEEKKTNETKKSAKTKTVAKTSPNKKGTKKTSSKPKTTAKKSSVKKEPSVKIEKKPTIQKTIMSNEPSKTENKVQEEQKINIKKETSKDISQPNLLSFLTILLMAILVTISIVTLFMKAKESTYSQMWENKSYLVEKELGPEITCDELANAILGEQAFIFATSYNGEEEFELEKSLAKIIKTNALKDFYIYPLEDSCGPISSSDSLAARNLKLSEGLSKTPAILYYRNGQLQEILMREDNKMLEAADFQHLLDIYEITSEK